MIIVEPTSKKNLTLEIEKTAAKLARRTELSTTNLDPKYNPERTETIKQELLELQKQKIDAKLFHARKELKATFKKCKAMELQKQIKRVREAEKAASIEATEVSSPAAEGKEKKQKKLTKEDIPRLENERELLKNLDLDALVDRSLRNKLLKHKELGENEVVKSVSFLAAEPATPETNQTVLDLGARILRHKTAQEQYKKLISYIQHILNPTAAPSTATTTTESTVAPATGKKRKNEESGGKEQKKQKNREEKNLESSLFIETLGGSNDSDDDDSNDDESNDDESNDGGSDDESGKDDDINKEQKPSQPKKKKKTKSGLKWDDPNFDKYYHGEKKKNRMGQRERRKKLEELYGKEANHIKEARKAKQHLGKKGNGKKSGDGAPSVKQQSPKQNVEEFHPSWQAKLKQQEMMAKALSGEGKPANNKIVFD
ncbi:Bud-site selection protein [Zychaea mexicana]|uniref:Bud-site selection protein n=1 Tax=Zychaea mexicana TaxID=64656 RepID=UPI0022FE8219|nr:Bud-site selection protein [Zychaea mexicana]KAI9489708.1 Bud-site selection protein [Zychaea mexicana]